MTFKQNDVYSKHQYYQSRQSKRKNSIFPEKNNYKDEEKESFIPEKKNSSVKYKDADQNYHWARLVILGYLGWAIACLALFLNLYIILSEERNDSHVIKKNTTMRVAPVEEKNEILSLENTEDDKVLFYNAPEKFINTLAECIEDKHCKIYYFHVSKTGGSYIASRMYPMLMKGKKYKSSSWCCGKSAMKRFRADVDYYCSLKRKFTVWEVHGHYLEEVLRTCQEKLEKNNSSFKSVVLTSIREPISRTLSKIDMRCNQGYDKQRTYMQEACDRCSYEEDKEVWDKLVNDTNQDYLEILNVAHAAFNNTKTLILDLPSIDLYFRMLKQRLPTYEIPKGRQNKGRTSKCDFGMTSTMVKNLALSEMVYKNLTLGL